MILTQRYRIKDSGLREILLSKARAVNFVWNFCEETQRKSISWGRKPLTEFDLNGLVAGSSKELGIPSATLTQITRQYHKSRTQFKKRHLRWRSNKRSLPWIPFSNRGISVRGEGQYTYYGLEFKTWHSRPLQGTIKSGSICADSRGRWYLNLSVELPDFTGPVKSHAVGIDLGLGDIAVLSDGTKYEAQKYYRKEQKRLAYFQRKGKKRQLRNLHARIANRRKDYAHKISKEITDNFSAIYVGDVSSSGLAKTPMAKSVYDASWYQLKSYLSYKALAKGGFMREVSERYSTQTCSSCGTIPNSSPKGKEGLNIREWVCSNCHTSHDRDINAALNILSIGTSIAT